MSLSDKHINPHLQNKIKQNVGTYNLSDLVTGIKTQDRNILGKAITLIESNLDVDQKLANVLLANLEITKQAFRIVITGSPGVGKSTFINSLCRKLIEHKKSVAVLATDPSSTISRGSILGDKTRMENILSSDLIYVRPSASSSHLGGVTKRSFEKIDLLNAAGFDYIILETVGVGQSEFSSYQLSDLFLLLVNPGGGDELQGMKRGIVEMADMICINKNDGDNKSLAKLTKKQYESSNKLLSNPRSNWNTSLHLVSALTGEGMTELWSAINNYHIDRLESGLLIQSREDQNKSILESKVVQYIYDRINKNEKIERLIENKLKESKDSKLSLSQIFRLLQKELDSII